MPGFGGFYKGEKRKPKKGKESKISFGTPTLPMPEIISKKKKDW